MQEFSQPLGDAVKKARCALALTQSQLAEDIGIDPRTILNIENYKGNPKMKVLYPLVRTLRIDPAEVFYPENECETSSLTQLRFLLQTCTENEAAVLIPMIDVVLRVLRKSDSFGPDEPVSAG